MCAKCPESKKKINAKGLVINTLFGEALATQVCNTCEKEKLVTEFHIESASKRKTGRQRRKQCKDCWYLFNGDSTLGKKLLKEMKYDLSYYFRKQG
jgi:hypothetical protein